MLVCTAEFMSLYETERLVQEVQSSEINARNIVVNQLLDGSGTSDCDCDNSKFCSGRKKLQAKYLDQVINYYL